LIRWTQLPDLDNGAGEQPRVGGYVTLADTTVVSARTFAAFTTFASTAFAITPR
jgi:hypothetical protein